MFSQKKPYSAVTVSIENLTSEQYEEDDFSGIPELVEVIKLQASGPSEAARAIRKKLKYGNVHRQLRALIILDGLIQNAGPRFQRAFVDEPLLERLRVCGTSNLSDPAVKNKCRELFREWAQYKGTAGLDRIAMLHKVRMHILGWKSGPMGLTYLPRNFPRGKLQLRKNVPRFSRRPRRTRSETMRKRRPGRPLNGVLKQPRPRRRRDLAPRRP
jgi:hypothetical protein